MDMSKSYRSAVTEYLPDIKIVFDRFHIMQLVNKSVDKVRKAQQKLTGSLGYKTLKGNRFLLLSNYENLSEEKKLRLDTMLKVNEPLLIIHLMKEQLRILWLKKTRKEAMQFLSSWILEAFEVAEDYKNKTFRNTLEPLRRLGKTLLNHFQGILNFFDFRITNGKIEGINNKIKALLIKYS